MEAAFTQREWSAALVGAWHADQRVVWALCRAGGFLPKQKLTTQELTALVEATASLVPNIAKMHFKTRMSVNVRVLLARLCRHASEALWAGDAIAAVQLIERGGYRPKNYINQLHGGNIKERRKAKYAQGHTVFIHARKLSKEGDWKTVK